VARPERATSGQSRAARPLVACKARTPWVNGGGTGRPERAKAEEPYGAFALSGRTSAVHYTQGAALGWPLVALSGRCI